MEEPTTANGETFVARARLQNAFEQSPIPMQDRMFNLLAFVRSSLLVKALVADDLYRRILHLPGNIVEFGTWWGQNLILMENLRAIHEPFNKGRHIIGFDSFEGYDSSGLYRAGPEYADTLRELLEIHEGCNAFGHLNRNHGIVVGDVTETAPQHFKDDCRPIALAIFDMGPYEPTLAALQAIKPNLLPGSVIMFDEFTTSGEAEAFEKVPLGPYSIENMPMYPSKTVVTLR